MAIDDNTSYELTGYQVKDLAQKIRAKADSASLASVATSGLYSDLTGAPTIPTVYNGTLTIQQNGVSAGTFTANASSNVTIALTDTTYSTMTGASSGTAGTSGLVPAPAAGDENKVLSGAGTWVNQSGGGGSSSVTYYATSDNTQGFPTYYTYLYSDSARTTVVTPDTILNNFENGNTVLIEYESTQTGSSAYKMTLAVETVAKVGADDYRMNTSEISIAAGDYNQVETQFMTNWDGQSPFNGRWILVRNPMPVVNDGTLTIQQNGTTKGTFTANQSTASTVNIETIYADDQIATTPIDWSNILSHFYPVGSIYMSATLSTAAAVGEALGGTWVAWGAGRVPVGVDTSRTEFDTAEETGGAKTHTHGLSNAYADLLMDASDGIYYREKPVAQWSANYKVNVTGGGSTSITRGYGTVLGGSTDSGSNLQPYITCYMYKRTA